MRFALLVALSLALPCAARADLIPPPTRPRWNDPPAPLPPPPEALGLAAVGLACAAWAIARRRAPEAP